MLIVENSLDDLLNRAFSILHSDGNATQATRGSFVEITGVLLKLTNPRARLSRSEAKGRPFSCIGELFWYLSGRDDLEFIEYFIPTYADDAESDGTLHGAYGPRIFPANRESQIRQVIQALTENRETRRAVIQIFSSSDIPIDKRYKEIPCTTTVQFLIRKNLLECIVTMRSNDAFKGLPHDIFCFTMIQEMVARSLNIECGTYHHFVGSLHLYDCDVKKSQEYLDEGFHTDLPMPPMPEGDQFQYVGMFLKKMEEIRKGGQLDCIGSDLSEYWNDLLRLLVAYNQSENPDYINQVHEALINKSYFPFVERRKTVKRPRTR